MIVPVLALALIFAPRAAAPRDTAPREATAEPPAHASISRADADSFARKLDDLQRRLPSKSAARSVLLTEGEINSYLNLDVLPALPGTVRDVLVHIDSGRLSASGVVDIDQVKKQLSLSPWNPISFLRGQIPVNASARFEGEAAGLGRVVVEDVDANGVSIPISLIEQLVASLTRSADHPDGIDIRRAIRLPPPIRSLRLLPGRAFLDL